MNCKTSLPERRLREAAYYQSIPKNFWGRIVRLFVGTATFGWRYVARLLIRMKVIKKFPGGVRLFWGKVVRLPVATETRELFGFGMVPEPGTVALFWHTITPRTTFYDVGANYGFFSWLAAAKGAEVYAFEPNKEIGKHVVSADPSRIHVSYAAVSDTADGISFFPNVYTGIGTTVKEVANRHKGTLAPVIVPSMTLDEFSKKHGAPTVMKIDIEGGEYKALMGGEHMLKSTSPLIVMEVWPGEAGRKHSDKAAEFLRSLGYRSYEIAADGTLVPAEGRLSDREDNYAFLKNPATLPSALFQTPQKDVRLED